MIADKIKLLRTNCNMTQTELAKKLGITRSSVNAWEMGISVPSTQYIVELANIFNVSSDYILGISEKATINVAGLSEREVTILSELVDYFKSKNKNKI